MSLGITVRHHSASLVMPISDPRDRFFYPHHTPMKDTYNLKLLIPQVNFLGPENLLEVSVVWDEF